LKKYILLFAFPFLLNGCNLFKKTDKTTAPVSLVNTDTSETLKAKNKLAYQASATRVNDIIHTKLEVSFDWAKQYMYGKATITIKPYFYPTSTLQLDARGMEIKEVSLIKKDSVAKDQAGISGVTSKKNLEYKYENNVITIQLDKEYKRTEEYTIFIDYVSKPNELKKGGGSAAITDDKGLYFINPYGTEKNKPQQIWTQGETQSSSVWFPTIDRPNERMTQEINITVDKKYVTLSNGELIFSIENEDNTRTDCWKMNLPHAPYLAMMMIGEFAIVKDIWREKEVNYYVEKEYESSAKAIFGNTPEMLEFFSNKLGVEFAWNKYSQVVARDYVSGAMENTTAALFGEFLQRTERELLDKNYEYVVSHELFHEWFGDLVTCESWSNIPLNESFATYGEYLWEEYKYGLDAADYHSAESREGYLEEALGKQVNLIRFYYADKEDMFDAHSYNKGGQVLHMLRKYVGDDAFFASLKLYLETNKFSSVEIHNLRLAFEQVTGEDLNWFFNQWFLSSGHPNLVIKQMYDAVNKKEKIQIKQIQDLTTTPLYKLPIAVDIYANGKKERHKIVITKADETFEWDVNSTPDLVNVDAEKMVLCNKEEEKSIAEWAFQYRNAPLYLDRDEALSGLVKNIKDSVASVVILSALKDKFWSIREDVIGILKNIPAGHEQAIKEILIQLAKTDEKANVRVAAIDYLAGNYEDEDLQAVYKNALNDRSYSVLGSAIVAIAKANPKEGLVLAKQYENEKNSDVLYAIAELYANFGTAENNDFFIQSENKFTGYSKAGFIRQYLAFLKMQDNDALTFSGAELFKGMADKDSSNKWLVGYVKKAIKDLATIYENKALSDSLKLKKIKSEKGSVEEIQDREKKITVSQDKQQKIMEIYNSIR
jgi:aminopeptidase N